MSNLSNSQPKGQFLQHWMNQLVGPFVTIFTIHRPAPKNGSFNGVDEQLLERCLHYARAKNYRFASIDELVDDALNHKSYKQPTLCFTLDDGYADQVTRLLPVLLNYKAAPSFFVITDFIDKKIWPWDAKLAYLIWNTPLQYCTISIGQRQLTLDLSTVEKRIFARRLAIQTIKLLAPNELDDAIMNIAHQCQLLLPLTIPDEFAPTTWQQLRALEAQGLHVGSHTQSHVVLNSANTAQIRNELLNSRLKLQAELESPSSVFCYPLGTRKDFSPAHMQLVQEAGYTSAISTISNTTSLHAIRKHPFQIRRIGFPNSFEKFTRYTSWLEVIRSKFPF